MPLYEKLNILWWPWMGLPVPVGDIFWGVASGWHHRKTVVNGCINLCSCGACLYWTMYWYVECVQS